MKWADENIKKIENKSREPHHDTGKTCTVKPFEFLAAVSENGIAE